MMKNPKLPQGSDARLAGGGTLESYSYLFLVPARKYNHPIAIDTKSTAKI